MERGSSLEKESLIRKDSIVVFSNCEPGLGFSIHILNLLVVVVFLNISLGDYHERLGDWHFHDELFGCFQFEGVLSVLSNEVGLNFIDVFVLPNSDFVGFRDLL